MPIVPINFDDAPPGWKPGDALPVGATPIDAAALENIQSHCGAYTDTQVATRQATSEKGNANGYAGLDSGGKVPSGQLPTTNPGHAIQDEGVARSQRSNLNFVGAAVAVTDDAVNNRTTVTITTAAADLAAHSADTTDVHGITDTTGLGMVLKWDGTSNYVPATLRTDTSHPREFRGPTDPATIGTITLANYDTWVPSA